MAIDKIPLSPEWRRAVQMLADAREDGSAEATLIDKHGFSSEMLASLVRTGLATSTIKPVWVSGRMIKTPWMRITNAGRFALKD